MIPLVKLAVASDLHCHPCNESSQSSFLLADALRKPVGKHPVESLAKLVDDESLSANIVLCPGDITNQVNRQGLHSGWNFLKEIQDLLGATHLLATLGNHDIDSRHLHDSDPFHLVKGIRPRELPLYDRSARDEFWARGFCIKRADRCDVLIINSVAGHFDSQKAKRGSLSQVLLDELNEYLDRFDGLASTRIAMVHHHPLAHEQLDLGADDLMEKGELLLEILEDFNFSLVIHGHKHHPRLRYGPSSASGPTVLAAGSFSAVSAQLLSNTRNLFHIIELFEDIPECTGPGIIRSWEFNYTRGWSEPSAKSADFPATAGFGCRASPQALASEISEFLYNQPERIVSWEEVIRELPHSNFLLPRDLEKLGRELKENHSIDLWPRPPDRPEHAARKR